MITQSKTSARHGQKMTSIVMPVRDAEAAPFNARKKEDRAEATKEREFGLIEASKREAIEGRLAGMERNSILSLLALIEFHHPEAMAQFRDARVEARELVAA